MARNEATIAVLHLDGTRAWLGVFDGESGEPRLTRFHTCDLAPPLHGDALRALVPPDIRAIHAIIPRHEATLRIVTLPARDPEEIAAMVRFGVSEWTPFPADQVTVRHQVLTELPGGESRVLVAIVRNDVTERYVNALRDAGRLTAGLHLSTACLVAALAQSPQAGRVAVLDAGQDGLELLVLHKGGLEFSRGVAFHGAPAEDNLVQETKDALAAWRRDTDAFDAPDALLLAGCAATGAATALEQALDLPLRAWQTEGARVDGEMPMAAFGAPRCALGSAPLTLDFLPDSLRREQFARAAIARARGWAAAALALVLVALLIFAQAVWQRATLIQELRRETEAASPDLQELAAKQRTLEAIRKQVDTGGNALELIGALAGAAPESGLNITRITYDRESGLDVWGRARDKDIVLNDFLGALRGMGSGALSQLAQAHSQYESPGDERGQSIIHYQISIPAAPVEGEADVAGPRP